MLLPPATIDALIVQCRGEIAAVDAYDRALEKFAKQPEEAVLREIRNDHDDSVARLRTLIERDGGKIPHDGGAWGGLVNAVHDIASLVNDELPLQLLQKGEQVGITGYEKALADANLAEFHELLGFLRDRGGKHHARLQALRDHILEAPTRPMPAW